MIRAAFGCLALLTVVACTSTANVRQPPNPIQSPSQSPSVVKASAWPIPNPRLTPGAAVPCTLPRPPSQRDVPASEKRAVALAYGYTGPWSAVEFDHRVPFALCGDNGPANIWPEPIASARYKDRLEDTIIRLVKAHRLTLAQGQAVFYGDWRTAWCTYVGGAPCQP